MIFRAQRESEEEEEDERQRYGAVGERPLHAVEVAGAGALRLARQPQSRLAFSLLQVLFFSIRLFQLIF